MIDCPDFLPLGSVVRIKGSQKTLMVISRGMAVDRDERGKEYYDYGMCLYPEGLIRDTVVYSNHDCIEEVLFRGFQNDDDAAIVAQMQEVLPKVDIPKGNPQPSEEW